MIAKLQQLGHYIDGKPVAGSSGRSGPVYNPALGVELRTSEVFLESIVENIPHMIFVKDASGLRFVRFNKAGEELLGHARQNLIGKSDYELFPKEEADFFTGADRDVLRNRQVLDIPEEPILTKGKGLPVPSYEKNSNSRRKRPAALLTRTLRRHHRAQAGGEPAPTIV